MEGNDTAQRVSVVPTNHQQRYKEIQIKIPSRERTPSEQRSFQTSPSSRHVVKEVLICLSRGSSPEKHTLLHTFFDEVVIERQRLSSVDVSQNKVPNVSARLHVKLTLITFIP